MLRYIIRRLLAMIPLLFGITLLVFMLMYWSPGDFLDEARARPDVSAEYVAQMERELGLVNVQGEPTSWFVQYAFWLNNISPFKFIDPQTQAFGSFHLGAPTLGHSWKYHIPVTDLLAQRLPATLLLSVTSLFFAWGIAVPLGVLAAMKKDSIFDRLAGLLAYAALSVPEFFLALLAVTFAAQTGLFPIGGLSSFDTTLPAWLDMAWHLVLPTIVLGVGGVASMMRIMRANFIDYMRAEFVRTARAKGLPEGRVMFLHVLRNAINPLITAFGFAFSTLLSGALLVETVMNYPGLGSLLYESILREDQYVVLAGIVIGCVMLMLGNLLSDLLLAWTDPRVRLGQEASSGRAMLAEADTPSASLAWAVPAGVGLFLLALVPWADADFQAWFWPVMLGLALCLLVGFVGFVLWRSRRMLWQIIKALRHYRLGMSAAIVLVLLYTAAGLAPMLATHEQDRQNLSKTYHPPTALFWREGQLYVAVYERSVDNPVFYERVAGQAVPLKFFASGFEYKLFGVLRTDFHLLQVDAEALRGQYGDTVDLEAYPLYLLGSDATGRDVFSRLLYGSQISLSIGLIGISITMLMGFTIGGLSGYFGGKFDFIAMRLVEFLMAVPGLYLLLGLRSALASHFDSRQMYVMIIVILSLVGWAAAARVIRGMALSISRQPFVLAAESMGQSTPQILAKHLLPSVTSYLLVAATLSIPGYILGEAALSFLGLGIQEPDASWGLMLKQAQDDLKTLMLGYWWMLSPGAMIFLTVIAFNVLGDSLRDIVDPRQSGRFKGL